jgi:hypothetical protein
MAVLVGDILMSVRTMIPDMPGVLQPPVLGSYTLGTTLLSPPFGGQPASTLPAATYYLRFSLTTPWGESSASAESAAITINGTTNNAITISGTMPFGASTLRAYFGPQGAENQYVDITSLPINLNAPGTAGIVPNLNRAYLPDTDGTIFPAITVYSWLRDGLKSMADLCGGIYDTTGINTTAAIAMYQLNGDWKKITHAWVDGWPFELANKGEIFYRNKVTTSGSGIVVTDLRSNSSIIEYYPVPNRNGGRTVLTSAISTIDTDLPCATLGGFLLEYGLALVGTEMIAYQTLNGTSLAYCLRGLGGTRVAAWPIGTSVLELNGRFAGYRFPYLPRIGDSLTSLDCPPNWDTKIQLYMESRYRQAQRQFKEATELRNTFTQECRTLAASNRDMMGPKQVGEVQVNEVYSAGLGGGWLLP